MTKVNYEVELKTTGFVQIEVPDELSEGEIEDYLEENLSTDEIADELTNGLFASESTHELDVIRNSGYLDE